MLNFMRLLLSFFVFLLIINFFVNAAAFEMGIKPPRLSFDSEKGEFICKNLSVLYSGEKVKVILMDKWANDEDEDYSDFVQNSNEKLRLDYPRNFEIYSDKKITICLKSEEIVRKKGVLIFEVNEKNLGIMIPVEVDIKDKDDDSLSLITGNSIIDDLKSSKLSYMLAFNFLLCIVLFLMLIRLRRR